MVWESYHIIHGMSDSEGTQWSKVFDVGQHWLHSQGNCISGIKKGSHQLILTLI